jgi:hypothetical protein
MAKSDDTLEAKPPAEKKDFDRQERLQQPRRGIVRSTFVALGQFVVALVQAPLVLVRGRKHAESVVVYSAHPSFFLWLLILTGFVGAWFVNNQWLSPETAGWIYVWVLIYFIVTLLYDLSTKRLVLWIGIFSLLWLLSKYIEHVRNIAVLGHVFEYLANLNPKLDAGMATVISWVLLLPWIGSIFYMVFNGRKQFTPNEIGEFHFGEGSELTDRSGLRFRTKYRDVLEMILTFGGGDLLAVDNHQNVIKRWDNIIGLVFSWRDLDRILHQRSVVDEDNDDDKK